MVAMSTTNPEEVKATRQTPTVLGWPSDAFSVDHVSSQEPHTVLVFIPGNPGLIEFYIPMFTELVRRLGPGYCARGVANAGHSLDPNRVNVASYINAAEEDRDTCIPWTVDGQSLHKAAYMDMLIKGFQPQNPRFVFVAHSIGTHFCRRMLLLRPDLLAHTQLLLGLMPFIRMKAPWRRQAILNFAATHPQAIIAWHEWVFGVAARLPWSVVFAAMRGNVADPAGRVVATKLVRLPAFCRNFFALGTEEVRDVPECTDVPAIRYMARHGCPTAMLFAANDQWAPKKHMDELQRVVDELRLPDGVVRMEYNDKLKHDFVSDPEQVPAVVDFCVRHILRAVGSDAAPRSRL